MRAVATQEFCRIAKAIPQTDQPQWHWASAPPTRVLDDETDRHGAGELVKVARPSTVGAADDIRAGVAQGPSRLQ